jgi:hypothetical protein
MVFQRLFIDESGIHDGSPITTVAIAFAVPSVWTAWTRKWNNQKRPIKVFHAVDCANLRGEFKGWNRPDRDVFVERLLKVLAEPRIFHEVVGVKNDDLRLLIAKHPEINEVVKSSYDLCLYHALKQVIAKFSIHRPYDRLAFTHEVNSEKQTTLECFAYLSKYSRYKHLNMTLDFATKAEAVPLQAADIMAYEGNKRLRNEGQKERRAWRAINPGRNKVGLHYLDMPELEKLVLYLDAIAADVRLGKPPPSPG